MIRTKLELALETLTRALDGHANYRIYPEDVTFHAKVDDIYNQVKTDEFLEKVIYSEGPIELSEEEASRYNQLTPFQTSYLHSFRSRPPFFFRIFDLGSFTVRYECSDDGSHKNMREEADAIVSAGSVADEVLYVNRSNKPVVWFRPNNGVYTPLIWAPGNEIVFNIEGSLRIVLPEDYHPEQLAAVMKQIPKSLSQDDVPRYLVDLLKAPLD